MNRFVTLIFSSPFLLIALGLILIIPVTLKNYRSADQHFADQSQQFLHGKLYLSRHYPMDTVIKNGRDYWPQGPFPSVVIMPFQLIFGPRVVQNSLHGILLIILAILLYRLARLKRFDQESAFYLTAAFLLASPVIGIIVSPSSPFFAHLIDLILLVALLIELETKKRPIIMGVLGGAILATRILSTCIIGVILILVYKKGRLRSLTPFLAPIFIAVILIGWFNYARFGSIWETGYAISNFAAYYEPVRTYGLLSPHHIITNFYYYFLISLSPVIKNSYHLVFPYVTYNDEGLSFFIVAPFFVYSLKSLQQKKPLIVPLWIATGITLFLLMLYGGTGWRQFGPRYTADFLPLLYLLTLYGLKPPHLSKTQQSIIGLSALCNAYLILTPLLRH